MAQFEYHVEVAASEEALQEPLTEWGSAGYRCIHLGHVSEEDRRWVIVFEREIEDDEFEDEDEDEE